MSMSFGLGAKLSTSQKLTPQMQQAIKLLQMSSLELAQEVQLKLDSNPLLERIESSDAEDFGDGPDQEDDDNQRGIDTDLISFDSPDGDIINSSIHTDWEVSYSDKGSSYEQSGLSRSTYEELDDYQGGTQACIQDHVRWQLNFKHLTDTDMLIAEYLIDAMDDRGFIQLPLDELHQSLATMASFYQWDEIQLAEIKAVLRIIQSCDPLGVGAQNLSECLCLQLNKLPEQTPNLPEARAVLSASQHLADNNIKALMTATGLKKHQIQPALELIRTLNPSPGLTFVTQQTNLTSPALNYDIPDVLVSANGNGSEIQWQVQLNPDTLPKLRVNKVYASLVMRGDDSPDNVYLRENLADARLFIRSIEERNQNLLKVASCIVRRQQSFLRKGATAMQPLILKDVAEEVGLHESTVSRLTTSKSILTPQGLFSLKYFFSSHVSSSHGDVSSTAISAMIAQIVENEDRKKPLSDAAIQQKLATDGIDIARRTVAKYREAMNIGSSAQRKKKF